MADREHLVRMFDEAHTKHKRLVETYGRRCSSEEYGEIHAAFQDAQLIYSAIAALDGSTVMSDALVRLGQIAMEIP
jgi:hypothetical protein